MLGYGPEDKSTVLELTYNYGVTEYDKGNAYAQVSRSFSLPKYFLWDLWGMQEFQRISLHNHCSKSAT